MNQLPRVLERIDDGVRLSLNDDGCTYSFNHQRITMPTTYYHYSLERLMDTGAFRVVDEGLEGRVDPAMRAALREHNDVV